jgi:hypothetical protein
MTTTIRNLIRILSVAAVLAAAALSVPAGPVDARPKPKSPAQLQCEAQGYQWDAQKGCANNWCADADGNTYAPGDGFIIGSNQYVCDGFTGSWKVIGFETTPSGPAAPPLNGTASPSGTTSSGPAAPRPSPGVLNPR